jgi:GNAT superfamily N-acetyltransferase
LKRPTRYAARVDVEHGQQGALPAGVVLRDELRPGDVGEIVRLHGLVYAAEQRFDATFEAYVAGPLAAFVLEGSPRSRLWVAEQGGQIVGSVAIVAAEGDAAQLRWYLVVPEARGHGLGTRLLDVALAFAREQGYGRVHLWTVSALEAAARRYRDAGFTRVESRPGRRWGVDVVEERHELPLR